MHDLFRVGEETGTSLGARELWEAGTQLGINVEIANFDQALMLVDPNFDGAVSAAELDIIMKHVKDADLLKRQAQLEARNPFLDSLPADGNTIVRVFGLKAGGA